MLLKRFKMKQQILMFTAIDRKEMPSCFYFSKLVKENLVLMLLKYTQRSRSGV